MATLRPANHTGPPEASPSPPPPHDEQSPPPLMTGRKTFGCVGFDDTNLIRFNNIPVEHAESVSVALRDVWPPPVLLLRMGQGRSQITLCGNPWAYSCNGSNDARRLFLIVLKALFYCGWMIPHTVNVTRKARRSRGKYNALILEKQPTSTQEYDWICISFDRSSIRSRISDKLKMVYLPPGNPPVNPATPVDPPDDLLTAIRREFETHMDGDTVENGCFKAHFTSQPWSTVDIGLAILDTRDKLLALMRVLDECGFLLYVSHQLERKHAADLMVFRRCTSVRQPASAPSNAPSSATLSVKSATPLLLRD
ncbi:hypothetical protein F66182_6034 [Fusarium sp. NRRL 66182]|nr:hypothetical protein F66182_6034 [Fusarium sp. NRRL 66182]